MAAGERNDVKNDVKNFPIRWLKLNLLLDLTDVQVWLIPAGLEAVVQVLAVHCFHIGLMILLFQLATFV